MILAILTITILNLGLNLIIGAYLLKSLLKGKREEITTTQPEPTTESGDGKVLEWQPEEDKEEALFRDSLENRTEYRIR